MAESSDRGNFSVGDVSGQGIAIGHGANARVVGSSIGGDVRIDAAQLRATLAQLYDALDEASLPRDKARSAQTAAGKALEGVTDDKVEADVVVEQVKKVGETFKQANAVVQEGSALWDSVQKLAPLLGPVVGGARVVAAWFGIPVPH